MFRSAPAMILALLPATAGVAGVTTVSAPTSLFGSRLEFNDVVGQYAFAEHASSARVFLESHASSAHASVLGAGAEPAVEHERIPPPPQLFGVSMNVDLEELDTASGVTAVFDKQSHQVRVDVGLKPADGLAWGTYSDSVDENGWGTLSVTTAQAPQATADVTMYAAGFVEGMLTCLRLSQFHANQHKQLVRSSKKFASLPNIKSMFQQQLVAIKGEANLGPHTMSIPPRDADRRQTRYLLFQIWGIMDAFNVAATTFNVRPLTLVDMLFLNNNGIMNDLLRAYNPLTLRDRRAFQSPPTVFLQTLRKRGSQRGADARARLHPVGASAVDLVDDGIPSPDGPTGRCSALVRLTADDMLVGHATWGDYSDMIRVLKTYAFPLPDCVAKQVQMSSYPGMISSTDNFYVTDSQLVVLDTSIEILDASAFDKVRDFPVDPHRPDFMDIMSATRLAQSAGDWASRKVSRKPTGTNCAQWLVADYNRFAARKRDASTNSLVAPDDTLWLVEEAPGRSASRDVTPVLRQQGYFAGTNRPYTDEVREATGFTAAEQAHGDLYSFSANPRAKIFAAAAPGAASLYDVRTLMRRNLYPFGGANPNNPSQDVAARFDLNPLEPLPNGAIDAKVVGRCFVKTGTIQAISGPTAATQSPFAWRDGTGNERFPGVPHVGQPDEWNFDWVQLTAGAGLVPLLDASEC